MSKTAWEQLNISIDHMGIKFSHRLMMTNGGTEEFPENKELSLHNYIQTNTLCLIMAAKQNNCFVACFWFQNSVGFCV